MDPLQFAAEDVLLLFAGGVVETFHRSYDRSFRTPAAWISVNVEPRKHDRVAFTIGRTDQPNQLVYGPSLDLAWTDIKFELGNADEPNVRGFFAEVARSVGRA